MNKTDRLIVALLFCLLIGWTIYGRKFMPQPPPRTPATQTEQVSGGSNTASTVQNAVIPASKSAATVQQTNQLQQATVNPTAPSKPQVTEIHQKPERIVTLTNSVLNLSFSTWGGGISKAELIARTKHGFKYPQTNSVTSGPYTMDFRERPALSYNGISGLSSLSDFEITKISSNSLAIKGKSKSGLELSRSVALTNGYVVTVTDTIRNIGNKPQQIDAPEMNLGDMDKVITKASSRGITYLGAETYDKTTSRVIRWDKKLSGLFGVKGGCSRPDLTYVPFEQFDTKTLPIDWLAVKNKFFIQVLIPQDGGNKFTLFAKRKNDNTHFALSKVAASVGLKTLKLDVGQSYTTTSRYYVGPKIYSEMKALGGDEDHIVLRAYKGFGWWRMACVGVLWLMNALYALTHNYGIAIILLTIIVKVVFWPVTHKGTESMKKMKDIQPQLTELRKKYKDNPKKMQEQQMLLYRANGVNPVAGCLPMVIQMPVFIALFTVLRNAVELRFQSFLWIKDLCEPEGLLAGVIPFPAGGLNILPLFMAATMALQQKMTPTAGDPQQQKMMAFMPLMMLFFFYNMASALVLYWTVSQLLSILQLYLQQRKDTQLKAA